MVHVAHHGDDWRARLEILLVVLGIEFEFLLLNGCRGAGVALAFLGLKLETVFGAKLFGGGLVNGLIDIGKHTELHEIGNQLERLAVDGLSQLAHHDGRLERDDGRIGLGRETRRTGAGRAAGRFTAGRGFLLVFLFLASAGFTPGWHAAQINEADLLANLRAGGRFGFGRFGFLGWRFSFGFLDGHFGCFFRGLGFL